MLRILIILFIAFNILVACDSPANDTNGASKPKAQKHLVSDISMYDNEGNIRVVIEIPAGSNEKWEVNKKTGIIERDSIDGKPRTIDYLGYPANYGFIPQTFLPKELGGDGDPLDAIVLGERKSKGAIVSCQILGVLKLTDRGEMDDKLVLADINSPFAELNSLDELQSKYPGLMMIIQEWFLNYKDPGKLKSRGYAAKGYGEAIIRKSHSQFVTDNKK